MIAIPYILTFLTGFLGLKALCQNNRAISAPLFLCLACLVGIAESVFICFFSFVFFNRFLLPFILGVHLIEILIFFLITKNSWGPQEWRQWFKELPVDFFAILLMSGLLAGLYASIYPYGGWDAWQVWNFKSKFLLLSGTNWKELFSPMLWRSSPHYPLALPLFNAWTWSFAKNTPPVIPLVNNIIFNILIAGLMFSFLRQQTKSRFAHLPVLFLFLVPSYMLLASSQYCDIVIALFFLGALISIYLNDGRRNELLLLAGVFLGLLSFSKPEGLVLAGVVFAVAHLRLFQQRADRGAFATIWIATSIALIPILLFKIFLSPGNQTFINGLASIGHPSTLMRLKVIFAFLFIDIFHMKWGFLWGLILLAGLLNLNRVLKKDLSLFYLSLILYLSLVLAYYWVNTYFGIGWWLSVSLDRILSSLLPAIIVWISMGVLGPRE